MKDSDFFTFSEYMKRDEGVLTASMEDYLEMIYRLSEDKGFVRIHDLAQALNIQPPSATKMVQKLSELNFIEYERYGFITLSEKGKRIGEYLLNRHNIVENFLRLIGIKSNLLEETEKIEHTICEDTLKCFSDYVNFLMNNPEIIRKFEGYRINK